MQLSDIQQKINANGLNILNSEKALPTYNWTAQEGHSLYFPRCLQKPNVKLISYDSMQYSIGTCIYIYCLELLMLQ